MGGLSVLSMYYTKVDRAYVFVAIQSCLFISLLMICASYAVQVFSSDRNLVAVENHLRLSETKQSSFCGVYTRF